MPFKSKRQARWMFSQHPKMAKEWASKTDFNSLPESAEDDEMDNVQYLNHVEASKEKRDRNNAEAMYRNYEKARLAHNPQKKLEEFAAGGNKMENPTTGPYTPNNLGPREFNQIVQNSQSNTPVQGNNAHTRGDRFVQPATQSTPPQRIVPPTGGITPYGDNKGPVKQANDNVTNNVNRKVQADFNTGPNKGAIEKVRGYDVYTQGPDSFKGAPETLMGRVKSMVSMFRDDSRPIGVGIETAELFGKAKKPTEVACDDPKKTEKMITSEK